MGLRLRASRETPEAADPDGSSVTSRIDLCLDQSKLGVPMKVMERGQGIFPLNSGRLRLLLLIAALRVELVFCNALYLLCSDPGAGIELPDFLDSRD